MELRCSFGRTFNLGMNGLLSSFNVTVVAEAIAAGYPISSH
jgi:hypothetical protein